MNNRKQNKKRPKNKYVQRPLKSTLFDLCGQPTFTRCCVCKKVSGVSRVGEPHLLPSGKPALYSDGYCDTCRDNMDKGVKRV
jgi:hypothetical protein